MRVVFRADASLDMGTGHVMRCLSLARVLADRSAQVHFICRDHDGHLANRIVESGFSASVLNHETSSASGYASWIGASVARDAAQTIASIMDEPADWVVVDHYGLDDEWEAIVRNSGARLFVIDDLANRRHVCDALLDQNYFDEPRARYAGLVPSDCSLWLGPRYALLQSDFAGRERRVTEGQPVDRILIFVGGSDRANLTGKVLSSLSRPRFQHLHVDIALGPNHEHRMHVESLAAHRPRTLIHSNLPSLVDLMAAADLAIGAGGGATWERLCMGLPSLVFSLAPNQEPINEELSAAGLVTYAGRAEHFDQAEFGDRLIELIADSALRQQQSRRGQAMVDGLGASRMAEFLVPTAMGDLVCRPAGNGDMFEYFNWANEPAVRENALNTAPIPFEDHARWFNGKLATPNTWLNVLCAAGMPVGQVRFDRVGDCVWIDYSLDPLVRGRGWGTELIRLGARRLPLPPATVLGAQVKRSNHASVAVFRGLGFSEEEASDGLLIFKSALRPVLESHRAN